VLQGWRSRLAPSGTIWVALPDGADSDAGLARLRAAGGSTGFAIGRPIALADGQHAVQLEPAL